MNKPPIFRLALMPFIIPSVMIASHEVFIAGRLWSSWLGASLAWTGLGVVVAGIVWIVTRTCLVRHMETRCVAIEHSTYGQHCSCVYSSHKYAARWVCDACQGMGQYCVTKTGDWTVEHGKVVADTKKWANFGK